MSERFEVSGDEHGLVRLFMVDIPPEEVSAFDPAPALGVEKLDPEQVEMFPLTDLKGLGLSGYMREGLGIAEEEIDNARLDALKGVVLIIRSAAFGGAAVMLAPKAPLRWIGTYREQTAPVRFEQLPGGAAEVEAAPEPPAEKRPSDAAMSGRVATVALIVIFALTAIVVWIA